MSENTQENSSDEKEVHTAEEDKQEHIKQRLKEMGVSEDSERPAKPWYIKYSIHMLATILVVIGVVYYLESSRQKDVTGAEVAHQGDSSMMTANNQTMSPPWSRNGSPNGIPNRPVNAAGLENSFRSNDSGYASKPQLSEQQKKINELQANYQKSLRENQLQEQKRQRERYQQMLKMQKKHQQAMSEIYRKQSQQQQNNFRPNNRYTGAYSSSNWRTYPPRNYYGPNYSGPNYSGSKYSGSKYSGPNYSGSNVMPPQQTAPQVNSNNQVANSYPPQGYYQRSPVYPPAYRGYPNYYNGWPRY